MKTCYRCKIEKPLTEFTPRVGHREGDGSSKFSSYCKKCYVDYVGLRQKEIKILGVEYLGGKCVRCGYKKCLAALDFHHIDPSKKDPSLATINKMRYHRWEIVKAELDKCMLLCANCHREEHEGNN